MAQTFLEDAPRLKRFDLLPVMKGGKVDPNCDFAKAHAAVKAAWPDLELGYVGSQTGTHYFQHRGSAIGYAVVL